MSSGPVTEDVIIRVIRHASLNPGARVSSVINLDTSNTVINFTCLKSAIPNVLLSEFLLESVCANTRIMMMKTALFQVELGMSRVFLTGQCQTDQPGYTRAIHSTLENLRLSQEPQMVMMVGEADRSSFTNILTSVSSDVQWSHIFPSLLPLISCRSPDGLSHINMVSSTVPTEISYNVTIQSLLTELQIHPDTASLTRVRLSYSLLDFNPSLEIFSLLSGMSPEEAALYQVDWPEAGAPQNTNNWTDWKRSLQSLGARND